MSKINPEDVHWCTWGDDNNGRVFRYHGNYYRGILRGSAPLYRRLLDEGILEDLSSRGVLVTSRLTDLELDGYSMVLEHQTIPFISYPYEWCFSMLRDAGKCILEVNRCLLRNGLTLVDGHPHNVLFRGTQPIFVDVGSIVEHSPGEPLRAYSEFVGNVLYPLKLQQRSEMTRVVTQLLDDRLRGISDEEYRAMRGSVFPAIDFTVFGKTFNSNTMNWRIRHRLRSSNSRILKSLANLLCQLPAFHESAVAEVAIEQLDRQLDSISIPLSKTQWGDYYSGDLTQYDDVISSSKRDMQICQAIDDAKPRSLIDLAGNQGFFSILAHKRGVEKIVCADYDLTAIEKLYQMGKLNDSQILPIHLNVMLPCGGSKSLAAPEMAVHQRLKCDMALALAITHHLSLTQRIPFSTIAATLASYTHRHLLVEFMPFGLGIGEASPAPLPEWYTLDEFRSAFALHFPKIEVFETNFECNNRILLVCEK